jgi:nitrite reductase/ring-hydroxylating ferredoxin subunit/uncharacterized membrane protein
MSESTDSQGNVFAGNAIELAGDAPTDGNAAPAGQTPLVERVSDTLQNVIKTLIGAQRRPPRRFKSLLHGTWLRHPLHPALSDVPIGAWLLAAIFDVIWLLAPTTNAWASRAAIGAVIVGILAAFGAIATGLADWSDSYGAERTVGLYHGLLNSSALVLYLISLILRLQAGAGDSAPATILGFVGVALVLIAAYFGGDMVFDKGTSVNHTAWEAASDDYEAVLPVASMQEQKLQRVVVAGVPVVVLRLGENYYAISATCTHAGGPLDEGTLEGDVVSCPWHGSRFSMRTGRALTGPASIAQPRYAVRVRNGQIELKRLGGH